MIRATCNDCHAQVMVVSDLDGRPIDVELSKFGEFAVVAHLRLDGRGTVSYVAAYDPAEDDGDDVRVMRHACATKAAA